MQAAPRLVAFAQELGYCLTAVYYDNLRGMDYDNTQHERDTVQHDLSMFALRTSMDKTDSHTSSPMSEMQTTQMGQASRKTKSGVSKTGNIVKARISIVGTRPLLQHAFGPDALPLEGRERTGVAGNDPDEWKRTMLVTKTGQLYLKPDYLFSAIRDGAKHTKKGRGSIQTLVAATIQIVDSIVLLDRAVPADGPPLADPTAPVYIDVAGVRNPATKARNVRYRLAASSGWKCTFTIQWDKTIVAREQMRAVVRDTGILCGLADGRSIGYGRFEVEQFEELDAQEAHAA